MSPLWFLPLGILLVGGVLITLALLRTARAAEELRASLARMAETGTAVRELDQGSRATLGAFQALRRR